MHYLLLTQMLGFLGLRLRYWLIILVVILVIAAFSYRARGQGSVR